LETGNRKAARSPFSDGKDSKEQAQRKPARKPVPPDHTNAENFYYIKQMQAKTPMVIVLKDGEELHGVIEWYDKASLKVNRSDGPNLLVYKSYIKYMYKAGNA
jgi:host factor-I protein